MKVVKTQQQKNGQKCENGRSANTLKRSKLKKTNMWKQSKSKKKKWSRQRRKH